MNPVRRFLTYNWKLKLAALGLSFLLWGLVQTEPRNAETFTEIPVEVMVADTGWTMADAPDPPTVELRLSGPFREMYRERPVVRVPIPVVTSGDTVVSLRRDWVELASNNVLVESIFPSNVRIDFEEAAVRALPVSVRVRGELPEQLAFASPIGLNPTLVRVRGPTSRVEVLDSVRLQPFDLSNVTESGVYDVPVDTTDLRGLRVTPRTASLGLRVEEQVERVLVGVPVTSDAEGGSFVFDPRSVRVTLRGARTLVTAVDPGDLTVRVAEESVEGMVEGEQREVGLVLDGVPPLVTAETPDAPVTVRRAADADRAPGIQP